MLIGRDSERAALEDALRDLEEGISGFFLITGEAGMGKTSLLQAVSTDAAKQGVPQMRASGWEAVDVPPFWIWDETLRQLGLPGMGVHASGGRAGVFRELLAMLEAQISEPHLLLFDDLHAADEDSLLALSFIVSSSRIPLLVVGAVDTGGLRRVPQRELAIAELSRRAVTLPLVGLSREEAAVLIDSLRTEASDEGLVDAVHRATEGNPLFIEEVVRMLSAHGELHRADHSVGFRAPAGVRGVVQSRAGLLDAETREVLMVASVIGRTFEASILQGTLGLDLYETLERLEDAAAAGFVEQTSSLGSYRFRHILVREAFYEDLSTAQRMRLHHRVAMTLEGEGAEPSGQRLQELAHHWFKAAQAGDFAKALDLSHRAAREAAARQAYEESERLYKRALQVAESAGAWDVVPELQRELVEMRERDDGSVAVARSQPESNESAIFRLDGELWTVRYRERETRLRDTKGMRYIAQLLKNPGRDIHVLDLVGSVDHADGSAAARPRERIDAASSDQPLLDAQAKRAYKQRLEDLQSDLEEAQENNDPERAARLTAEIDALVQQLASAAGLGGRDRLTTTPAERARINVTKVVREALRRIAAVDPDLGDHFAVTVRTGTYLSYMPDPRAPLTWVV